MKKSNQLSLDSRFEPLLTQFKWPSANVMTLAAVAVLATIAVVAFQKRQEAKVPEMKSVAWYVANQKEARATNKECFDNPALQQSENCVNSLHALEITYKGPNS